ncbi:MAG: hypothetical protein ACK5M0_09790 [Bacteroidales bacterium]
MNKYRIANPNNKEVRDCKSRTTGFINKMKILKQILSCLALSLIHFTICAQEVSADSSNSIKEMIIDIYSVEKDSLSVSYKKSEIPKSLKKELKKKFDNFRIVNPNCEYRKTDVIRNQFLPNKQLVFIIKYGEYYSLVFREGGRAHSTYFVFSKIVSNRVKIISIYNIRNKVSTVEEFLSDISIGNFWIVSYL